MANVDKQDFIWNWKLSGAVNQIYTDLINVDVVKPPYSNGPRNSSFFLQTRLWYIAEKAVQEYIYDHYSEWWLDYTIEDVNAIWDTNCSEETWIIWLLVHHGDSSIVLKVDVKDWCVDVDSVAALTFRQWENASTSVTFTEIGNDEDCKDLRFFKTDAPYIVNDREEILVDNEWWWAIYQHYDWIQENRLEWWVYRWYFATEMTLSNEFDVKWADWLKWKYLVVNEWYMWTAPWYYQWMEGDWMPWQVRMIIWVTDDKRYLILDNAWDWFRIADENWNTYKTVTWKNVEYYICDEMKESLWITNWENIFVYAWDSRDIEHNKDRTNFIIYTPTHWNIISMVDNNWRMFALYDNWWVRYSTVWWRDKFFFNDELFVWADKTSLYAFKDTVIALGKRKTSVLVPEEFEWVTRFRAYEQSATIWLKSRYSYWEHDGNFVFVSNDNRLMAIAVANTTWKYMLELQDIWQDVINAKLSLMLDSDEAFISDFNNDLNIIVQSKPSPGKEESKNSQTHIYKFDTVFHIWTEDHLRDILIKWSKYWIYYWRSWVYIRWLVTQDNSWDWHVSDDWREGKAIDFRVAPDSNIWYSPSYWMNYVEADIAAFMSENEITWLTTTASGTSTWAPDLFRMIKLNRLAVLLGYWKYSEQTRLKVTSYREWIWEETIVPIKDKNDWIELVSRSYLWNDLDPDAPEDRKLIEKKQCLLDTIEKPQTKYVPEEWDNDYEQKVEDLIPDTPWCESTKRKDYQDHNISIDTSIYELAPHKPLVIRWIWDTQSYSSQVKVELLSRSWDILNFGWFEAELYIAPSFLLWADWENLIEMGSC